MHRVIPTELLESLAAEGTLPADTPPDPPAGGRHPTDRGGEPAAAPRYIMTPAGRKIPRERAVRRCRGALKTIAPAVEGKDGSGREFNAACCIHIDFGLDEADGFPLLEEHAATGVPPWSATEIRHKWDSAVKKGAGCVRGSALDKDAPTGEGEPSPVDGEPAAAKEPAPDPFVFITSAEFATGDYRPQWLIEHVLVKAQPGTIAGPSKTLKTGLALDAAISLATGTKFLGEYAVPKKVRTAVLSGESGPHTLQETAKRQCAARNLNFADLGDDLVWCFTLPTVSDVTGLDQLAKKLKAMGVEVVFIDPLYLSLGAVDPRNVFEMGNALRTLGDLLLKAGATPILIHHANGKLQTGEVMELQHLSYTGLEQYTRQFMLINRHSAYKGEGRHDLWVSIGGSAGHGRLLSVAIEEGVIDRNFEGRTWGVTVKGAGEAKEDLAAERERAKAEAVRKKIATDAARVLDIIDEEATKGGATKRAIRNRKGWSAKRVDDAVARLFEEGRIETIQVEKKGGKGSKRPAECLRRVRTDGSSEHGQAITGSAGMPGTYQASEPHTGHHDDGELPAPSTPPSRTGHPAGTRSPYSILDDDDPPSATTDGEEGVIELEG